MAREKFAKYSRIFLALSSLAGAVRFPGGLPSALVQGSKLRVFAPLRLSFARQTGVLGAPPLSKPGSWGGGRKGA